MKRTLAIAALVTGTLFVTACGDDGDAKNKGPFELIVHPQFVQGALPGIPVTVLVTVHDVEGGSGEVSLSANFPAGTATVSPESIAAGEIAEVTFTAEAVDEDLETAVDVTAERGSVEHTASRSVIVMPGVDDLGPMAADLLEVFKDWLRESHPELGIGPERDFDGNVVAPRLLVVSHYLFADEEYELGLSWHVTIQPHDWAELYIRPRDALTPTKAFKVSSWSAALEGGEVEFTEVSPPEEVVR
jgi:hypothetical protein